MLQAPPYVTVDLADGRVLEALTAGPDDGLPLVFHNGTPTAAALFPPMVEIATSRGLRLVTYSRPGYAGSTARPGRSVADAASDVAALLDALGATSFLTIGWSGGGPHALACVALLSDRCLARPHSPESPRFPPTDSTGWRAWDRRTSRSSRSPSRARQR